MRPLVIGVDARELLGAATGVGRYLGELLARWTTGPDASARHFILYTPRALSMPMPRTVDVRVLPGGSGTWWEQTTLAAGVRRYNQADVLLQPPMAAGPKALVEAFAARSRGC